MTDPTTTASAVDPFAGLDTQAAGLDGGPLEPGQTAAQPQPEVSTAEVLEQVIAPGFALLAPAWDVSAPECAELAKVYGALIDKYFPGGVGSIGVELSAALITLTILGPRLHLPRKIDSPQTDAGNTEKPPATPGIGDGIPNTAMA